MRLTLTDAPWTRSPQVEPLSLTDAKAYLKIEHTAEDALLAQMIREARSWAETFMGRALIDQTWRMTLSSFPVDDIRLPKGRTIAVTSIAYTDTAGSTQTLASYQSDLGSDDGGVLMPAYGAVWPDVRETIDPVRVTFRAGYTSAADIPSQILAGLKWKLADIYSMRGDVDYAAAGGGGGARHDVAVALLTPWKLTWF